MDMTPVSSSNIAAIGWEVGEDTAPFGELHVEFKNGRTYRYEEVDEAIFNELKSAPSIGKAFQSLIRGGGYFCEQV